MNATLPLVMAQALAPFAPPSSVVHQIVREAELSEAERQAIDTAMHADIRAHNHAVQTRQVLRRRASMTSLGRKAWKSFRVSA